MNIKSLISKASLLQTFLAGAGFLAPDRESARFFAHLKYYIWAIVTFGIVGTIMLLTGLYLYLIETMPPYAVCMIMGGAILAIGLITLGTRAYAFFIVKRKFTKTMSQIYREAKAVVVDIVEDVKEPIAQHPKIGIAIAVVAGFLLFINFFGTDDDNRN